MLEMWQRPNGLSPEKAGRGMCKWGSNVLMTVPVSARKSHTGKKRMKTISIDACLAPIIKALLDAGIETEECCCGHGHNAGYIGFADDRCFIIVNGHKEWDIARDAVEEYRRTQ